MRHRRNLPPEVQQAVAQRELDAWEARFGRMGGMEIRGGVRGLSEFPLYDVRIADDGAGRLTLRGHAAVYEQWSLDLGWFRERILRGAFDGVLEDHTSLNIGHDDRWLLSTTRLHADPLELESDMVGLSWFARVMRGANGDALSYEQDVRTWLENGAYRQGSFAFIVARDEWRSREWEDDAGWHIEFERDIIEVERLFDVCICEFGAYPQTDSELVRSRIEAYAEGRLRPEGPDPGAAPARTADSEHDPVAEPRAVEAEGGHDQGHDDTADRAARLRLARARHAHAGGTE